MDPKLTHVNVIALAALLRAVIAARPRVWTAVSAVIRYLVATPAAYMALRYTPPTANAAALAPAATRAKAAGARSMSLKTWISPPNKVNLSTVPRNMKASPVALAAAARRARMELMAAIGSVRN